MNKVPVFLIAAVVLLFQGNLYAEELPPLPPGPLVLSGVTSKEMLAPEYWIKRLPHADQVLKTPEELKAFNKEIDAMVAERLDVFELGTSKNGSQIRSLIEMEYGTIAGRKLFGVDDKYILKEFFPTEVKPVLNLEQIPEKITLRWGAATKATSVRALPTWVKMLEEKGDIEFDQLQFTLIKLWTPVAIYHESADGKWYYVQSPYVRGWVMSKDIALFEGRKSLKEKAKSEDFLDVTGESVPVCADSACETVIDRPSMGTVLPLAGKTESDYLVWMPVRSEGGSVKLKKAYVNKKKDVTVGFPAYTQANFIRQAFKLLAARYGWGGTYNGRDCSGFTFDVFLSMGVDLPRDSGQQAFAGTQLGHYEPYEKSGEKIAALDNATEGITLMRMSLHIMLYLGKVDGKYYAIHSTWAERIGDDPIKDEKRRINQVVVSDLNLNGNSYLGGLFDRIIQISEVL